MIRLQKYTPDVYYERSRDFQFIGRLYDVVLNSVKTNADIIKYGLPFSAQSPQELLVLMAYTLGFKPKHKYSHEQLLAICEVFSEILRNKGSLKAVQILGEAILRAEGIVGSIACLMQYDDITERELPVLRIYIPETLAEISLFYDLLEYILPAGCKVEIIRGELFAAIEINSEVTVDSDFIIIKDIDANNNTRKFRFKVPSNTLPIQNNKDNFNKPIKELSEDHIVNSFIWRQGNRRREDRQQKGDK
jgi:hypothetical protein